VLQALATGELALTHEALDTRVRRQAAEYLRYRLMACGLLPVHGRHLRAYQSWLRRPADGASPPTTDVHPRSDEECDRCGTTAPGRRGRSPRCTRCRIVTRLEKVAPAVLTNPELRLLLEHLFADPRPDRIVIWLGGGVVDLLQALGGGEVALTHEALHAWRNPQAVPHLRQHLVACGLLPAIDPHLAYFETWLHHRLAALADHPHHRLLHRFAVWHQLPRLRADAAARPLRATARNYAVGQFVAGTVLLTWLDEHRIEPRHLTQAALDQWCLEIPTYNRHRIRGFLLWATQHGHLPPGLDLPNLTFQPGAVMTQQHRTELLRRYLNDETDDDTDSAAPLHARTAACLLLLYAQPLSLILRLTHDDLVDIDCECHLRFGDPPSPVPPPIATLLDRLVADNRRRGHSGPWLFPGRLPGQPIAYRTLLKALRRLGFALTDARVTALRQLVQTSPAPVIAEALGFHHHHHAAGPERRRHLEPLHRDPSMTPRLAPHSHQSNTHAYQYA